MALNHLHEERNHVENVVNARFNFFMAFFVAIVGGLLAAENTCLIRSILILGFFIEGALFLFIVRAQIKLDFYLKELRKDPDEAETAGKKSADEKKLLGFFPAKHIKGRFITYGLPGSIVVLLFFASFFPRCWYVSLFL